MAEYKAVFRSNYFGVKDAEAFRAFCDGFGLEMVSKFEGGYLLHSLLNQSNKAGIPFLRYNAEADDWEPVDFLGLLAGHLLPGYVAVILEVGSDGLRYLIGEAYAVNAAGEIVTLNLDEIYQRAAPLGSICTDCSY